MLGRVVKIIEVAKDLNFETIKLQLPSNLSKGTYIIRFENNEGSGQEKLIIE